MKEVGERSWARVGSSSSAWLLDRDVAAAARRVAPGGLGSLIGVSVLSGEAWEVLNLGGQATKGAWGMSWRRKAMKGVEVCEKPGGADKRALIPGFPNEHTLNP